jgi:hypothetical protein
MIARVSKLSFSLISLLQCKDSDESIIIIIIIIIIIFSSFMQDIYHRDADMALTGRIQDNEQNSFQTSKVAAASLTSQIVFLMASLKEAFI